MKYVLCIDGGGVRCLTALSFLKRLEEHLRKLNNSSIYDQFDCYAGTSAGSLIVAVVTYTEISMNDALNGPFNYSNITKLFEQSFKNKLFNGYFYPLYSSVGKTSIIHSVLGDKKLSDTTKDTLFIAYDILNDTPCFFKSYEDFLNLDEDCSDDRSKERSKNRVKKDSSIANIVDASSSATTYFAPVSVNGIPMMDGGICANNPTDCLYADLIKMYPNEELRVLSIGLTKYSFKDYPISTLQKWGKIQWILKGDLVSRFTAVDTSIVDYRMNVFTKAMNHKYLRIIPEDIDNIPIDARDLDSYNKLIDIGGKMFDDNISLINEFFNCQT
jgi:patatin-like phospholipase/acyl hydrolase